MLIKMDLQEQDSLLPILTGLVTSIIYASPNKENWQNSSVFECLIEICSDGIDNDDDCPSAGVVNTVSHQVPNRL